MIEIRRIAIHEAPVARELIRLGTAELADLYPDDEIGISEAGLDRLETLCRVGAFHEDEVTLVAAEDAEVVGFISASIQRGRALSGLSGEIGWFWVRPRDDRAMVERQLASTVIGWLRDRSALPIFKMEDAQIPRRDLWEALGFEGDVIRFAMYD